jgi:Domain of unknown function (DUF3368).
LGVLALLVKKGYLTGSEADDCLMKMIRAGYRSPVKSVSEIPGFPSSQE